MTARPVRQPVDMRGARLGPGEAALLLPGDEHAHVRAPADRAAHRHFETVRLPGDRLHFQDADVRRRGCWRHG